jgi:membrane protease YdiL (CAAX protease family)
MAGTSVFRYVVAISMYAPLLAALIVNKTLKGMGWKPRLKGNGNVRWIFWSILIPAVAVILGAAVFYAIYPDFFDSTAESYMRKQGEDLGVDMLGQLESKGISPVLYTGVVAVSSITYAGFINMFFAVGEEAGWRGFLYTELRKGFGRVSTWIIGGVIWAAFHFPVMIIGGYEYGTDYLGAPVLGLIVFSINCIANGLLHEIIYDKTKCIWFPALLHGGLNAVANVSLLFWNMNAEEKASKLMILGPAVNGIIGMIPMVIFAVIMAGMVMRGEKGKTYNE